MWGPLMPNSIAAPLPFHSSQILFAAFTGEQWGYLGSRRLLLELQQSSPHMHGITYEDIKQVSAYVAVLPGHSEFCVGDRCT